MSQQLPVTETAVTPFTVDVPDSVLVDLRERLGRARLAPDFPQGWGHGTDATYLQEFVDYWRDEFDWRAAEREINRLSHYRTTIDDVPIHFVHERGVGPSPTPIILNHGWPWTFWDLHQLIGPLSDPGSHGGDPEDAFDVVVPSLPGFGFSSPLRTEGIELTRTADMWVTLMRDRLGYDTFSSQGGDWGASISAALAHQYPEHLNGVHLHLVSPLGLLGNWPGEDEYDEDEKRWSERSQAYFTQLNAYALVQATQASTLAHALHDSPTGLASWLLEKRRAWSDCGGDLETRFSKDFLCTTLTIYWATQTFGSSARYYAENARRPWAPRHDRLPRFAVPTGFAVFPQELFAPPRAWAESNYDVQAWDVMPSGGHFASMEEPERLVESIRSFFRHRR